MTEQELRDAIQFLEELVSRNPSCDTCQHESKEAYKPPCRGCHAYSSWEIKGYPGK